MTLEILTLVVTVLQPEFRVGELPPKGFIEECLATEFGGPDDKYNSGIAPGIGEEVGHDTEGIAHRTLPFGTRVRICNVRTHKCTKTVVIDRGPFGRLDRNGRWYNGVSLFRKAVRENTPVPKILADTSQGIPGWRGCVDMPRRVRKRIGHNGLERVRLTVL